eukprot:scaffold159552_cov28-Tisochrysis_lutea.AAC.2
MCSSSSLSTSFSRAFLAPLLVILPRVVPCTSWRPWGKLSVSAVACWWTACSHPDTSRWASSAAACRSKRRLAACSMGAASCA